MQVLIKIDKNLYTRLFDNGDIDAADMLKACVAIRKGTPLPKGHGDLIDRRALISNGIEKGYCDWYDEIKYADTIIEAEHRSRE